MFKASHTMKVYALNGCELSLDTTIRIANILFPSSTFFAMVPVARTSNINIKNSVLLLNVNLPLLHWICDTENVKSTIDVDFTQFGGSEQRLEKIEPTTLAVQNSGSDSRQVVKLEEWITALPSVSQPTSFDPMEMTSHVLSESYRLEKKRSSERLDVEACNGKATHKCCKKSRN